MALLHDLEVDEYLADCVRLDDVALDEEFMRLPADLAYWTHKYAQAVDAYLRAKFEHERSAARLFLEARRAPAAADTDVAETSTPEPALADATDTKGKKKTAAPKPPPKPKQLSIEDAKATVEASDEYQVTYLQLTEADVERTPLRGLVDAITTKRDMLQSLGAKLRAEMERDPMVRARVASQG